MGYTALRHSAASSNSPSIAAFFSGGGGRADGLGVAKEKEVGTLNAANFLYWGYFCVHAHMAF